MKPTAGEKVRLGAFTLLGVGLLVAAVALTAGVPTWGGEGRRYPVRFKTSVGGLTTGSRVKVNGVMVGRVTAIELDPANIEAVVVTVDIEGEVPVKADMVAVLVPQGITGGMAVELRGGTQAAADLAVGEEIPVRRSPLQQLLAGDGKSIEQGEDLLGNLVQITAALRGDPEHPDAVPPGMMGDLKGLIEQLTALSEQLAGLMADNRSSVQATLEGVADASGRLDATLEQTSGELRQTLAFTRRTMDEARVRELSGEVQKTLQSLRARVESPEVQESLAMLPRTLEALSALLERVDALVAGSEQDVRVILANLRDASENLAIFSRTIRDDPSVLLRGPQLDGRAP